MGIDAQNINEELAKGTKIENMSSEMKNEFKRANQYLRTREGECPQWMENFFESNKNKLVETICRAISRTDGISSLSGYYEGYFNEIIQNANDLHCGEDIEITVKKQEHMYSLSCQYDDKGFELSNIYGFLNREMSDKASENGQTGKFGVGIKSFFKFVDSLKVDSNVKLDFTIQREQNDVKVKGNVALNSEWNKKTTVLSLKYNANTSGEFNTKKLTKFIDSLFESSSEEDNKKFFITGEDNELIFDLRSLIFMRINGWKIKKKSISRLSFKGECHKVELLCENVIDPETVIVKIDNEKWDLFDLKLLILVDGEKCFEQEYVVFENEGIAFAFPYNCSLEEQNRLYSTYYLKTDTKKQIRPLSMLVDTKYSNIHRNDVGDSEENIQKVYDKIKEKMLMLYSCMCSDQMELSKHRDRVSDVFHSILVRYMDADSFQYKESPLNCYELDNRFLPKKMHEQIHEGKKYIVVHDREERYECAAYAEGDIVRELKKTYLTFVEGKNVFDYQDMVESQDCISGVRRLYKLLNDKSHESDCIQENMKKVAEIVNYFEQVQEFLAFIICHERREKLIVTDAEIDRWLIELEEKIGTDFKPEMFLKLVGRYEINPAINFNGTVTGSKLNFKDYLFNGVLGKKKGILAEYQNKQFDEKYSGLKQELLSKRYIDRGNKENRYAIRCIKPEGRSFGNWGGNFDFYNFSAQQIDNKPLSKPELFLERLATDASLRETLFYSWECFGEWKPLMLFEKEAAGMQKPKKSFAYYHIIEQQIINVSCIKQIKLSSFLRFIEAVKYRKKLDQCLANQIYLSCVQKEITTQNIANDLLPRMIELQEGEKNAYLFAEFTPENVTIMKVIENTSNEASEKKREFIQELTYYDIHLYHFESKTRRKIVAYCGEGKIAIRTSASGDFRNVAKYNSKEKDLYIFYDNFEKDSHNAIALVLDKIGIPKDRLELFQGYIHNGNHTKTMNYLSRRRDLAKLVNMKRKIVLDWCDIKSDEVPVIYDNEILYRLLTARGSYDIFCPICADIPSETFDYGEDTKKKHSREIIILENDNLDTNKDIQYIVTIACSYCVEKLRNTLSQSEFDGKYLTLTTQIAHGQHEKTKSKRQIELSPINVELMRKFTIKKFE